MLPSIFSARLGLSSLRTTLQRTTVISLCVQQSRSFASVLPDVPATAAATSSSSPKSTLPGNVKDARQPGALRPHLGVEVNPNHGLYAFFRKKEVDGKVKYETLEAFDISASRSGRSWSAAELRRKSFKDLHTLWYVLLRERNLLATQAEEGRRTGITPQRLGISEKKHRVRKSMARIKYVINERRLAYEGAVQVYETRLQRRLTRREEKREEHKKYLAEKARQKELREQEAKIEAVPEGEAANLAAAGLFTAATPEPISVPSQSQS